MLPILPEESPSPDWRRDRELLPEAVVAGVPPALWLIPQPTRLPLKNTRKAAASGRTIRRFEHYRLGSVRTRLSIHYLQIGSELLS